MGNSIQIVYPGLGFLSTLDLDNDGVRIEVWRGIPCKGSTTVSTLWENGYTSTDDAKSKRLYVSLKTLDKTTWKRIRLGSTALQKEINLSQIGPRFRT